MRELLQSKYLTLRCSVRNKYIDFSLFVCFSFIQFYTTHIHSKFSYLVAVPNTSNPICNTIQKRLCRQAYITKMSMSMFNLYPSPKRPVIGQIRGGNANNNSPKCSIICQLRGKIADNQKCSPNPW